MPTHETQSRGSECCPSLCFNTSSHTRLDFLCIFSYSSTISQIWSKLVIQASVRNKLVYDQSLAYLTESSGGLLIFGHSTEGPFTCRNRWNNFLKPSKSFLDTWRRKQAKKNELLRTVLPVFSF